MTVTETRIATDVVADVGGFALKSALAAIKPAVSKRAYPLILSGVRIDAEDGRVTLTATDLDLSITATVPGARVIAAGTVVAPFGDVAAYVAKLTAKNDQTVTMSGSDGELTLERAGRVRTLRTLPAEEWPQSAEEIETPHRVNAGAFADVLPAASKDDARPILTGVVMSGGMVAATDSYRLYASTGGPCQDDESVLVPARALREVVRHACAKNADPWVQMGWSHRELLTRTGDVEIRTRVIDGEFPRWQSLVPTVDAIRVNYRFNSAAEVVAAIGEVSTIGHGEIVPLRVTAGDGGLSVNLTMAVQDRGTDTATVTGSVYGRFGSGAPWSLDSTAVPEVVAFNDAYLAAMLKDLPTGDGFTLEAVDAMKPAVVRTVTDDGRDLTRLLMPIRV